jgi:serine protease inhibitor
MRCISKITGFNRPSIKRLTSTQPFHLVGGKTDDVSMMRLSAMLPIRQDDRFVTVELPYATEGYSLVVVTTKSKPANVADFTAVAEWLTGKDFDNAKVELSLPKFTAAATSRLLHSRPRRPLITTDRPDYGGMRPHLVPDYSSAI